MRSLYSMLDSQMLLWLAWRPWLGTMTLAIPVALILSHVSRHWARGAGVYLWAYVHPRPLDALADTIWAVGATSDGQQLAVWGLLNGLTLAIWSFAAGAALAAMSRGATWTTGSIFYIIAVAGSLTAAVVGALPSTTDDDLQRLVGAAAALQFALTVIAPALWGMRCGRRPMALPIPWALALAVAAALLTARGAGALEVSVLSAVWGLRPSDALGAPAALALAVSWPVAYVLAISLRGRPAPHTRVG